MQSDTFNIDPEEITEEEKEALIEINDIKAQIEEQRRLMRTTDFVKVTEEIRELGRLKFKIRRNLRGHLAKINDLNWSHDSKNIVTASQDGKLIIWDTVSANKLHMVPLKTAWVIGTSFNPTSTRVASGGLDNICSIFDVSTRETPDSPSHELHGHDGYISTVKFLNNEKLVSASGDKTIAFWDIETGKMTDRLYGHTNDVTNFALSFEKNTLVSVSTDKEARLWDIRSNPRTCIQWFDGHKLDVNGVCFLPNSSYGFITASDDYSCRLWDIRADQAVATYIDEYIQSGSTCCTLSKSGRLLIAGYDDYNCHVWDVLREERVGIMSTHEDRVSCVEISPDGFAVSSAAWDSNCHIWTAK